MKLRQALYMLLCGVSCVIILAFGRSQGENIARVNSMSITGVWKLDSVDFKIENNMYLKGADICFKFNSNLILANNIHDSIGFCYYPSVKKPNTISLLVYFSMYQLKFPYIYQVNSNEAIKYFKSKKCTNLKFKTLKFENKEHLELFFLKLTDTYEYFFIKNQLVLNSKNLNIYLSEVR